PSAEATLGGVAASEFCAPQRSLVSVDEYEGWRFQLSIVFRIFVICCVGLLTVTVKVVVDVLPAASLAVQVTVVVPIANRLPEAGTQVTVSVPSTASVAVGLK